MEPNQIEPLMVQLGAVKEIKPFSMNLKPVVTVSTQQSQSQPAAQTGRRGRRARARRTVTTVVQETRPGVGHTRDFAKLMHSPMIDLEKLAKPVNEDENRSESALKYISLWGTTQVNINTAPRQVLEAAFTFGGDAPEIAEQIIKQRKIEPFKDIDDLKRKIFRYSDSIEKARPYITAQSNTYTIRVKAISGVAKVCATAGVKKEENGFQKIGIIVE
jgi:DNA uptake protein ComE-like DNA-binding protein